MLYNRRPFTVHLQPETLRMAGKAMSDTTQQNQTSAPPGAASGVADRTYCREDFHYDLPEALIAQHPTPTRDGSRLLAVTAEPSIRDLTFSDLPALLEPGDLLVVNDTRVIKARLQASKDSGGRAEVLLERILDEDSALCQVRVSKPLKTGRHLVVGDHRLEVTGREGQFYQLRFDVPVLDVLDAHGSVPLPPYIDRGVRDEDEERYQTVWSASPGAVAAPTAGLHFTETLLARIEAAGVRRATVTLHVGAGTFQPVRVRTLSEHSMHSERYQIDPATVAGIRDTRARGGRVVAVGTTVVRALESAAAGHPEIEAGGGETSLFITPGYDFRVVDALITNFHLPESTLLMLVTAFGGYERVMAAYRHAVDARYRFFSYGDAMFLTRAAEGAHR
jgi:S-adenosylmethionine:tRNA ribosyltransferase-isomerase